MGRSVLPSDFTATTTDIFFLGRDERGAWVAQDAHHKKCGLFVSEAAARRYIKTESNHTPIVFLVSGIFEPDLRV